MTPAELTTYWHRLYGIEPRAHLLRVACRDRWFRIYGLPEGKRYPDGSEEHQIVLRRHNDLLSQLLGRESSVVLITTRHSFQRNATDDLKPEGQSPEARHWISIPGEPDDDESGWWHLFAQNIAWKAGLLDALLTRVADCNGEIVNVIVLGIDQKVAYHPYDGGADVITKDPASRNALADMFKDWLSPLPSGL